MGRFIISQSPITMHIKLEYAHLLKIHEEIIPSSLQMLSEQIKNDNCLKNPVVVDDKTLTVLDGSHRYVALKDVLGVSYIPICAIDYDSPLVKVGVWYRIVQGEHPKIGDIVKQLTYDDLERIDLNQADEFLNRREIAYCIVLKDRVFAKFKKFTCSIEAYLELKKAENAILRHGLQLQYLSDLRTALEKISIGEACTLIIPPPISKEDVRNVALRGLLYPPKSTRHVIPSRPLFLNIPLDLLYDQVDKEHANTQLMNHLSKGVFERLPPFTLVDDRMYAEEVLIFRRIVNAD